MNAEMIYQIGSVLVIPIIVDIAKRLKLPSKWAPVAAFGVALVLVSAGKMFGLDLDINTVGQTLLSALTTAGISVIGYDQIKKLTEKK